MEQFVVVFLSNPLAFLEKQIKTIPHIQSTTAFSGYKIPSSYLNAAFLSKATQISSSATNCASLPVVLCPADNTVSESMSPWWITGFILRVMSNLCMSLTFLLCNWSSRLKLCRRHPLTPLIPFISLTEALVCRLTKPLWEECRTCPIMLFFCSPPFHQLCTSPPHFTHLPPPRKSHQYYSAVLSA